MRIIAGAFRGRKLLPPERDATRPITDRVKQSLFDILAPLLPEAIVYDCFAGTGSMGLESLSRGAKRAVFFEADRSALARLRKNIESLKVQRAAQVISGDLFKWFSHSPAPDEAAHAHIIFLDPPYRFLKDEPQKLKDLALAFGNHLAAEGVVVFRHDAADRLDLPPLACFDRRDYGGMTLEFLRGPMKSA